MDWAKKKPEPSKKKPATIFLISITPQAGKKKRNEENRNRNRKKNNPRNSWCLSKNTHPAKNKVFPLKIK
jgi:hypothetical protein